MLWRVTLEGRLFLAKLETAYRNRNEFAEQIGIGKNQVKPLIEQPDHTISQRTIAKIRTVAPTFQEGTHYLSQANSDRCEIRFARDRSPTKTLSHRDKRGLTTLYEALLQNQDFASVTPFFDSVDEFRDWFKYWGNSSEDMPAEQFFVYRLYGETVISFLYGERYLRSHQQPLELFAIWYLVGSANAFYDGSPVGLDSAAEEQLPLGERQAATSLMVRLLEELRVDSSIDFLLFDIVASEIARPESHGRLLLRLYARAEAEVRVHFASDPVWRHCQFFVLDFPYMLPRWDEQAEVLRVQEHRLFCCPMRPAIRKWFQQGAVPASVLVTFVTALYQTFWEGYDADATARAALQRFAHEAIEQVKEVCIASGGAITCFTLSGYVTKFRNNYR